MQEIKMSNEEELREIGSLICDGRALVCILRDYCEFNCLGDGMIMLEYIQKILGDAMERISLL